jgi:hypothetical protein
MIPSIPGASTGLIVRYWRFALVGVLLVAIAVLKLSLAGEQRHSAKLQHQLRDTLAAYDRFKAEVAARTAFAKAEDEAHARRIERDQILVSQETIGAYQKDIASLHARAAQRMRANAPAADSGRGRGTPVSAFSQTARGADGAAGEDGFSEADRLNASEIALRLKALQEWLKGQGDVER